MHGVLGMTASSVVGAVKRSIDIEALLTWAFVHELPKRQISSAEGIWDRWKQYGSLGGVNPDPSPGGAQRYAQFGLPHPDAEKIEKAVAALQPIAVDWDQYAELLLWDLAALVSINEIIKPVLAKPIWTSATVGPAQDGRGISASPDKPRDLLLVHSTNVEQLVYSHAVKGTRPNGWHANGLHALPEPAERGPLAQVVGYCRGRNSYSLGSYCPLRWHPSPTKVILARANYLAWHNALRQLAAELSLQEHEATAPAASATPWIFLVSPVQRVFHSPPDRSRVLPLNPTRKLAGPKLSRKRHLTTGGKSLYRSYNSRQSGKKTAV